MKKLIWMCAVLLIAALIAPVATIAGDEDKETERGRALGLKSEEALKALYKAVPDAEKLFQKSVGWAFFEVQMRGQAAQIQMKAGGDGVAMTAGSRKGLPMSVDQSMSHEQKIQWIFMFQTKEAFDDFVDGWEAGATPKACARMAGLKVDEGFVNGVKVYTLPGAGGVAEEADISTAKFRKGFHATH